MVIGLNWHVKGDEKSPSKLWIPNFFGILLRGGKEECYGCFQEEPRAIDEVVGHMMATIGPRRATLWLEQVKVLFFPLFKSTVLPSQPLARAGSASSRRLHAEQVEVRAIDHMRATIGNATISNKVDSLTMDRRWDSTPKMLLFRQLKMDGQLCSSGYWQRRQFHKYIKISLLFLDAWMCIRLIRDGGCSKLRVKKNVEWHRTHKDSNGRERQGLDYVKKIYGSVIN